MIGRRFTLYTAVPRSAVQCSTTLPSRQLYREQRSSEPVKVELPLLPSGRCWLRLGGSIEAAVWPTTSRSCGPYPTFCPPTTSPFRILCFFAPVPLQPCVSTVIPHYHDNAQFNLVVVPVFAARSSTATIQADGLHSASQSSGTSCGGLTFNQTSSRHLANCNHLDRATRSLLELSVCASSVQRACCEEEAHEARWQPRWALKQRGF